VFGRASECGHCHSGRSVKVSTVMNRRSVARNIGAFVLFLILYTIIAVFIGVIFLAMLDNVIVRKLLGFLFGSNAVYETSTDLLAAALAGFLGVPAGVMALDAIMKNYSVRGVGVAFILWIVANDALHFIQFPQYTDYVVYRGLVQSAAACVTAWFVFHLPPFTIPSPPSPLA
jgi:hypothetical protein